MNLVRNDLGLSKKAKRFPKKDTCLAIYSHTVNTCCELAVTLCTAFPWCTDWPDELKELFSAYVSAKQRNNVLDYDDLLLYWRHMMEEPALAAEVGARFDHMLKRCRGWVPGAATSAGDRTRRGTERDRTAIRKQLQIQSTERRQYAACSGASLESG